MSVTHEDLHAISSWVVKEYEWWPNIILREGVAYCQCPIDLGVIRITRDADGNFARCCQFCQKAGTHVPYEVARSSTYRCEDHPWSLQDRHSMGDHLYIAHQNCEACKIQPGDIASAMLQWRRWETVEYIMPMPQEAIERLRPTVVDPRIVRDVWTGREWVVSPIALLPEEPLKDLDFECEAVFGY